MTFADDILPKCTNQEFGTVPLFELTSGDVAISFAP
jgi:hypothetical protein